MNWFKRKDGITRGRLIVCSLLVGSLVWVFFICRSYSQSSYQEISGVTILINGTEAKGSVYGLGSSLLLRPSKPNQLSDTSTFFGVSTRDGDAYQYNDRAFSYFGPWFVYDDEYGENGIKVHSGIHGGSDPEMKIVGDSVSFNISDGTRFTLSGASLRPFLERTRQK